MKTTLNTLLASIALIASCCAYAQHTTKLILPREKDGAFVRLLNYDTKELIDSLPIQNDTVCFASNKYPEGLIVLEAGNYGAGNLILSDADIEHRVKVEDITGGTRRTWETTGGYNDSVSVFRNKIEEIGKKYQTATGDEERNAILKNISSAIFQEINAHGNDVLGYLYFNMGHGNLSYAEIESLIEKYPALGNYKRVQNILTRRRNQEAVKPGNKFKDFTVTYDGVEHKLSDVVGHGDYVLLDFWASWCGPCRAAMPTIKKAYEKYKNQNLKILGVTIWDEPEKSLEAMKKMELPWEIWVNGGDEPANLYNITAVPTVILFGPDGTVLERGLRENNLLSTLEKYIPSAD
ncbi:MAG: TlpA family protein disulfide reductase [Paramuribaculum sp.]|nr:TlpA family protein disulfide reductase [Paramuribaculum sp.]